MDNIIEQFREKTEKLFCKVDGYSARELEEIVHEQIESMVMEYNLDVVMQEVVLSGSRCRGLEHDGSDLDFVVSFLGQEREDVLFNVLNESHFEIDGVKVDINPINEEKTGSLEDYLLKAEKYLERLQLDRIGR